MTDFWARIGSAYFAVWSKMTHFGTGQNRTWSSLTSLCGSPRFGSVWRWFSKKTFFLMKIIRARYWSRGCVGGSSFHTSWLVNSSLTFCWTLIGLLKRASYLPFDHPNLFYDLQDHVVPVTVNVITWSWRLTEDQCVEDLVWRSIQKLLM